MSTTTRRMPWHQRLARAGVGPVAVLLFVLAFVLVAWAATALGDAAVAMAK